MNKRDYAIMEHARNVVCFAYKGSWSDLGVGTLFGGQVNPIRLAFFALIMLILLIARILCFAQKARDANCWNWFRKYFCNWDERCSCRRKKSIELKSLTVLKTLKEKYKTIRIFSQRV